MNSRHLSGLLNRLGFISLFPISQCLFCETHPHEEILQCYSVECVIVHILQHSLHFNECYSTNCNKYFRFTAVNCVSQYNIPLSKVICLYCYSCCFTTATNKLILSTLLQYASKTLVFTINYYNMFFFFNVGVYPLTLWICIETSLLDLLVMNNMFH